MKRKLSTIFAMLFVMTSTIIAYTFIHELGHGIAAIATGGRVIRLSIALARTWYEGASTQPLALSLNNIFGMLLPVLLSFVSLFFYHKNNSSLIYHFTYGLFITISTGAVLVWVVFPVIPFLTSISPGEDVTNFLVNSGLPSIIVSLIGILIIAVLISFAVVKKLPQAFLSSLKTAVYAKNNESNLTRKTIVCLLAVTLTLISGAVLLEVPFWLSKPLISLTVSDEVTSTDYERKFAFAVPESGRYQFAITLEASGYTTDIRILDELQNIIYQNIAESTSSEGDLVLNKGEYTIQIIHLLDLESFNSYCREMNYSFGGDTKIIRYLETAYQNVKKEPFFSLVIK